MKYQLAIVFFTSFVVISPHAYATCDQKSKTMFFCIAKKTGKNIELCDLGKTIQYSFGTSGSKPDLALSVPRERVSTSQWDGMGRNEPYSVNVPNGSTIYSVFWELDKLKRVNAIEAGVNVTAGGKALATILCADNTIVNNLIGIDLKKEQW